MTKSDVHFDISQMKKYPLRGRKKITDETTMYVSEINEDISEIHEIEIQEEILEIPEIQETDESELPGTSQGSEQPDMTESDLPDDLPRKQKFTSLADVCDIENYSPVTAPQNKKTYTYRDAKGTMTMNWSNVLPSLDRNPRNAGRH